MDTRNSGAQALQMGGVGLPIYAFKDKWTTELLKINVIPNDRTNAAIGHLFLDFVAEKGGIGLQITVDKGSEIGWMLAIQDSLRHLFNWTFPPLIQAELDEFQQYWNSHTVRFQKEKLMPSGHVPSDAREHPEAYGGIDCFIQVPRATVNELRETLSEEVGPREQHLEWVSPSFDVFATLVYNSIGKPLLTLENSWKVFSDMASKMEALGHEHWPENLKE
ncbi:hypothetical protein MIND_01404500 [Mycena indigotica]|uniref:Uncharacterized protein n=1 Tax=Mycena indigotica TaxID=2126181 RepID=A0A8H6VR32_9AGAR|nr:uncharacterized protein MIND_01404500 [Mycena indigotica]KAF7288886.1 hypothetical protein MIND_01404500 [Mycena indigotica]